MMKKIIPFLLACFMIFGTISTAYAVNWQWVTSTDDVTCYFDKDSIKKGILPPDNGSIYSTWIKFQYTDSAGKMVSRESGYKVQLSNICVHYEFNYKNKTAKVNEYVYYDVNGNVISRNSPVDKFRPIVPNSTGDKVFNASFPEYQERYGSF